MIDIFRSEWTKLRSVRSTLWTLGVTALLMIGISALLTASATNSADGPVPADQGIMLSLMGVKFASLSMATLGVLVISSEYRTGGIRTSLMAVPRRINLLTGKAVVFTGVSLVVSTLAAAASVATGLMIMKPTSIGWAETAQVVAGAGLYLTVCGLFGLGLGTLIRHTPGAIVTAIALMMVLPQLTSALPGQWGKTVSDYFTTNAGELVVIPRDSSSLGPWDGLAVYFAWVAVALIAGAVLLKRRDA
ncbi:ABC transporter permease [Nonomuraea sp. NPDC050643]|uniref:ABC transporter permease n=1 Tax=Nonomuraea sp. NPDC050643 TaxID=3155660 RepID=UPI003406BE74